MTGEKPKIWIGEFRTGEIVVFDSRCQERARSGSVILWNAESETFDCHAANAVKPDLKTVDVLSVRDQVLDRYRAFVRRRVESNHRARCDEYQLPYTGTRTARRTPQAGTRCFLCETSLDATIDVECTKCGWTLCGCGACGCFFRRPEPPWNRRMHAEHPTLDEYAWDEAYKRWQALPPRSTDPEEICSLLHSVPVKIASGFCGMCDSNVSNDWCLPDGTGLVTELRHYAQNPGDVLRQSEHDLLVAALERGAVRGSLLASRQTIVEKFLGWFGKGKWT